MITIASVGHTDTENEPVKRSLTVSALFAGIGGIEAGLHLAGHRTVLFCEIDRHAQYVLRRRFDAVDLVGDVAKLDDLPDCDLVTAGFPCQDLSQAGRTAGIAGRQSGLVDHVFRLLTAKRVPTWLLLENVPFMLHLDRGRAMGYLVERLERLGYRWAYRVVDTRAFGLPQRRRRVLFLASRTEDPRRVLYGPDAGERPEATGDDLAHGFYWTEGYTGLGWAVDAVPTLKGGSGLGIPSAPAIWMPDGRFVTPDIRDGERLQGFPAGWTQQDPAEPRADRARWKLVGNAVTVEVAKWIGARLLEPDGSDGGPSYELANGQPWPLAAWGIAGKRYGVHASPFPVHEPYQHLAEFMMFPPAQLSHRAAKGFLGRARSSSLRFVPGFLEAVERHVAATVPDRPATPLGNVSEPSDEAA